ncbi:hypothetical protein DSECCO2_583630 [anaerobic digester metagenome]
MIDQHLSVAIASGADADGGDGEGFTDLFAQNFGNTFQHQHKGSCFFDRGSLQENLFMGDLALALDLIPAKSLYRLWGEAQMRADGDLDIHDLADGFQARGRSAFQLHGIGFALYHQTRRVCLGLFRRKVIGQIGQIADNELVWSAPAYCRAMYHHVIHADL